SYPASNSQNLGLCLANSRAEVVLEMKVRSFALLTLASASLLSAAAAERINHEGRILGLLPTVTNSVLFNTSQADAIVSALQIFPVTNPWNEDISRQPRLPNSDAMIAHIIYDVASKNRT